MLSDGLSVALSSDPALDVGFVVALTGLTAAVLRSEGQDASVSAPTPGAAVMAEMGKGSRWPRHLGAADPIVRTSPSDPCPSCLSRWTRPPRRGAGAPWPPRKGSVAALRRDPPPRCDSPIARAAARACQKPGCPKG